ncbi:site-specific integrase [Enterococcus sp. AZ196]|uniref:site-specific integrase n=1 Tax=Enterococcus sp. AZ196 TaxID=2774659 RepID=UPI003D2751B0
MASVVSRNKKFAVAYRYIDESNKNKQKWESFDTKAAAKKRKKFIEFYQSENGPVIVPIERKIVEKEILQEQVKTNSDSVTVEEFLKIYVEIYGQANWSVTTFRNKKSLIKNYINPLIGKINLDQLTARFLSKYYHDLLSVKEAAGSRRTNNKLLTPNNVKKIHDLIRSALNQAIAWEYLPTTSTNPASRAVLPKVKKNERKVWELETFRFALDNVDDELLNLCMHLAFACSLRIGEVLGLTWDNLVIDDLSITTGNSRLVVEKQLLRVSKEAVNALRDKDVIKIFPSSKKNTTSLVLMTPKTESSRRTVWIPKTVAEMLVDHKRNQEKLKDFFGKEYVDYNLVISYEDGKPVENKVIGKRFRKLCEKFDLPKVDFHSLRHLSTMYKLKMTNGDIKSVQGDTGHSKADMVTEVYSHIVDADRKNNAEKLNQDFYGEDLLQDQDREMELLQMIQSLPKELANKLLSINSADGLKNLLEKE